MVQTLDLNVVLQLEATQIKLYITVREWGEVKNVIKFLNVSVMTPSDASLQCTFSFWKYFHVSAGENVHFKMAINTPAWPLRTVTSSGSERSLLENNSLHCLSSHLPFSLWPHFVNTVVILLTGVPLAGCVEGLSKGRVRSGLVCPNHNTFSANSVHTPVFWFIRMFFKSIITLKRLATWFILHVLIFYLRNISIIYSRVYLFKGLDFILPT